MFDSAYCDQECFSKFQALCKEDPLLKKKYIVEKLSINIVKKKEIKKDGKEVETELKKSDRTEILDEDKIDSETPATGSTPQSEIPIFLQFYPYFIGNQSRASPTQELIL